ncbi:hypothetical protein WI61_15865 [Burkholderia cepacia]|uniref:hypothetical protein n=1 Tax=Burkholderia cepacia TaxID=292 RepID=UPI000759AA10|nr:hypothetical protein [Burkholderia cepacia]KVA54846.1 hypothetical protein WI48_20030 [Burkholderia cepacia]KVA55922.1 hypothetical protein WI49_33235 [Burkholderia cepacia]KVA79220.1 hypothetical protein WI50_28010 [Burkholderia cepacia]KVA83206.1 hypothetical protein WI52_16850 [Burkholderia cepacia]KVA91617.1 hypothetical protein WI51_08750 [Burkholderia cepacia]
MSERRVRRGRPVDPLARLFYDVTGEKPDDASLLRMRRVSTAMNLRDNDALWSVLAVLEYYARLYEAMPERIRQAGKGNLDAMREEVREAMDALMAQHRDALARCKATIELAERMAVEHEARYRATLAALNEQALVAQAGRAADRIARIAGNRVVGAVAVAAREHRQQLDATVALFERKMSEAAARAAKVDQIAARRIAKAFRALVVGALIAILLAAAAGGLAGRYSGSPMVRANGLPPARTGYASSVLAFMNARAS